MGVRYDLSIEHRKGNDSQSLSADRSLFWVCGGNQLRKRTRKSALGKMGLVNLYETEKIKKEKYGRMLNGKNAAKMEEKRRKMSDICFCIVQKAGM